MPGYAVFFVSETKRVRLTPFFSNAGAYALALEAMSRHNFQRNPPLRPGEKPVVQVVPVRPVRKKPEPRTDFPRLNGGYDLTGQRFGKLLVHQRCQTPANDGHRFWECHCECGATILVRSRDLVSKDRTCCHTQHHRMLDERQARETQLQEIRTQLDAATLLLAFLRAPPVYLLEPPRISA